MDKLTVIKMAEDKPFKLSDNFISKYTQHQSDHHPTLKQFWTKTKQRKIHPNNTTLNNEWEKDSYL